MTHTFDWASGYFTPVSALAAGQRILALQAYYGDLIPPEALIEDARPQNSPIHAGFEWDDLIAGHEYRLEQARAMLRNCRIVTEPATDQPHRQKLLVHVRLPANPDTGEPARSGYMDRAQAYQDATTRALLVERALKELRSWHERYADFPELKPLLDAIARFLTSGMPPSHPARGRRRPGPGDAPASRPPSRE